MASSTLHHHQPEKKKKHSIHYLVLTPLLTLLILATIAHLRKAAIFGDVSLPYAAKSPVQIAPQPEGAILGGGSSISPQVEVRERVGVCDVYNGRWVKDVGGGYPLYSPGSCPFVDGKFACYERGRKDLEYLKWRWKPDGCDLPRFNATDFLERLQGKVIMMVGDSMSRNQYESLLCLLREALPAKKSEMYKKIDYMITKDRSYFRMRFLEYNCSVEYHRSYYLVRQAMRVNGSGKNTSILQIDQIDDFASQWRNADILIFNTGHWWTPYKTNWGKNFYQERDTVYPKLADVKAYRRALRTWSIWIEKNLKLRKNVVFLRGLESAHFKGGGWNSGGRCDREVEPTLDGHALKEYPWQMKVIEQVIQRTRFPVKLLNVTRLTNYCKDAHPSTYGRASTLTRPKRSGVQDCSHWCLPGVPDTWNELMYGHLLFEK